MASHVNVAVEAQASALSNWGWHFGNGFTHLDMQSAAVSFGHIAASARVQPALHALEPAPLPLLVPDELQLAIDRNTKQAPAVSENLRHAVIGGPLSPICASEDAARVYVNRSTPGNFSMRRLFIARYRAAAPFAAQRRKQVKGMLGSSSTRGPS
jgi:hypothetical protein